MDELDDVLDILGDLEQRIRAAGEIAQPETVIEVVPHSTSGKRYARKRMSVDGKTTFEGCGLEGSERHLVARTTLQRRRLLEQVQDLSQQIETWQRSEDWQALPPPEPIEDREIDADIALYEDEWDTALATETARERTESVFISFVFLGNKGATMFNRKVHAVPGEAPRYEFEFWDTPALCGVRPQFLKNWGWIGDCSILHFSCRRCEKKLKQLPHVIKLPDFMGGGFSQGLLSEYAREDFSDLS